MSTLDLHLEAARQDVERGCYDDAMPHLHAALAIDPACGQAHFWLGQAIYLTGGSAEEAVQRYEASARHGFDPCRAAAYIGIVSAEAEDFDRARQWFAQAVQHDPGNAYAAQCLAQTERILAGGRTALRDYYYPPAHVPHLDADWLETMSVPQSRQFAEDCLPTLRALLAKVPGPEPSLLDVGTATGAGANLIAQRVAGSIFRRGVRLRVDAIDLIRRYRPYARRAHPLITYICGNLFEYEPQRQWDITLCSHTIEHLRDPTPLIRHCQARARHFALFYAPFEEEQLIMGHRRSIRAEYIQSLDPISWQVLTSPGWQHPHDAQSRTVLFVLPSLTR